MDSRAITEAKLHASSTRTWPVLSSTWTGSEQTQHHITQLFPGRQARQLSVADTSCSRIASRLPSWVIHCANAAVNRPTQRQLFVLSRRLNALPVGPCHSHPNLHWRWLNMSGFWA